MVSFLKRQMELLRLLLGKNGGDWLSGAASGELLFFPRTVYYGTGSESVASDELRGEPNREYPPEPPLVRGGIGERTRKGETGYSFW
jgi:hypothetical protein